MGEVQMKSTGKKKSSEGSVRLVHEAPATIYKKLIDEGKKYQLDKNNIFLRTARTAAEEYELIFRMREQIDKEGMTIEQEYKTGTHTVAHPLLEQLPRHVDCLQRLLGTLCDIIEKSGGKREDAEEDLAAFRSAFSG